MKKIKAPKRAVWIITCVAMTLLGIGALGVVLSGTRGASKALPAAAAVEDQYEIVANDSGKTFAYPVTSRFGVFLDEAHYPKKSLSCSPTGVVGEVSNIPGVAPPLYAVRYEAIAPGTCILRDGDFTATVVVY